MPEQVTTPKNTEKKPVKPTAHFAGTYAGIAEALSAAELGVSAEAHSGAQHGVLVKTGRNELVLSAFDFETAVTVTLPVAAPVAKGYSLLEFVELKKALAAMVAGDTKAVAARTRVSLAGDLLASEHMALPVAALDMHAFVHPPEAVPAMATVDAQTLLTQLKRVLPAVGRDLTLPALTGIQMSLEDETLTMVATDRYRLAAAEVPTHAMAEPLEEPLTTLVPAAVLTRLAKHLKPYDGRVHIGIHVGEGLVARTTLSMGDTTLTVRSLLGTLPDANKLLPTECDTSVTVERATAVRAAKKCQALIRAKCAKCAPATFAWDADGTLTLAPRIGTDGDLARTTGMVIPSRIAHGRADTLYDSVLALDPAFLLDALGTFSGDTVTLHIRRSTDGLVRPLLLTEGPDMDGQGYQHLLMPVRLATNN